MAGSAQRALAVRARVRRGLVAEFHGFTPTPPQTPADTRALTLVLTPGRRSSGALMVDVGTRLIRRLSCYSSGGAEGPDEGSDRGGNGGVA